MSDQTMTRKELHYRRIDMRGYERSDGLFEVEGRVVDRKTEDMSGWLGGRDVPAHEPVHDMGVRIVFDREMTVHEIHPFTNAAPYSICPGGGEALQSLVGLRMTSGWAKRVREKLSGARACTHLMELLMPLATVAFQSMSSVRRKQEVPVDITGRPLKIDSCYAYGAGRELVKNHWPEFYVPDPPGSAG
jgi:DUF2889 family protein